VKSQKISPDEIANSRGVVGNVASVTGAPPERATLTIDDPTAQYA
jgi:hypothetical protein